MSSVWEDTAAAPLIGAEAAAEVDLGPLAIFFDIAAGIKKLGDEAEAERRRKESLIPGETQAVDQGLYPSAGNLVLDLGSAPPGRVWQVRRLTIGGVLATSTPTGSAFAYVRGQPPSDLSTIGVVDSWPSFSNGAQGSTYGTHQLWIPAAAHLFIVITGGTPGQQWVAEAQIEDIKASGFARMTIEE